MLQDNKAFCLVLVSLAADMLQKNISTMVFQRATLVPWFKQELERLVAWMEKNPEKLRRMQAVCKNDKHVMVKREPEST